MNLVLYRVLDRLMVQEYTMARRLGYSAMDAMIHVAAIRDDFRRMVVGSVVRE